MHAFEKKMLADSFDFVRLTFFPRWDKHREWKVKRVWHLPSLGKCDIASKIILMQFIPGDKDELSHLLIHEICHALIKGHGKTWQSRMLKAFKRANEEGHKRLAELIHEEVNMIIDSGPAAGAEDIYSRIGDCIQDVPNVSFRRLIKAVSREFGVYPKQFLNNYPKCKDVFLSTKKGLREHKKAQNKLRPILKKGGDA